VGDPPADVTAGLTVRTVGHGTLTADALASLLRDAQVAQLVDVRSFPGSRRNPQFGREEMEAWVPAAGIRYDWIRELGGRRRPVAGSRHVALRNDAFRAYADYMESASFSSGVEQLLAEASAQSTAVMCSESVWWRCHRRLLADHLVLVRGVEVVHLMHDGRSVAHPPTDGVRVDGDRLVYDVGVTPPLPSE
jgi:uncharacterized protein (DUF488 family)